MALPTENTYECRCESVEWEASGSSRWDCRQEERMQVCVRCGVCMCGGGGVGGWGGGGRGELV